MGRDRLPRPPPARPDAFHTRTFAAGWGRCWSRAAVLYMISSCVPQDRDKRFISPAKKQKEKEKTTMRRHDAMKDLNSTARWPRLLRLAIMCCVPPWF